MAEDKNENLNPEQEINQEDTVENQVEETTAEDQDTDNVEEQETAEVSSNEEELGKVQQELGEMKDKYLRLYSEFENYRRRTSKEKLDLIKNANEELIKDVLTILDDFERAQKNTKTETEEGEKIMEGLDLIKSKLAKQLEGKGLKEIEDSTGKDFDMDIHEAITQIPAPSDDLKGKVVDVIEKGYTLNDKVIRYAKVVVGA
ncbi:nucleotide exchange factor GrpE [Sediminitomix flava]|uniref:Protein GrpE n=1 Tax=Sediminitomix flava TaxID=379075 RepID=A0A315ZG70_SEDFL|nr:nucleotide exchange factor GrpE [Sediminitomix flava]PWJ44139.1 molecular chaperone GrpE [Sediminitomix flava]